MKSRKQSNKLKTWCETMYCYWLRDFKGNRYKECVKECVKKGKPKRRIKR